MFSSVKSYHSGGRTYVILSRLFPSASDMFWAVRARHQSLYYLNGWTHKHDSCKERRKQNKYTYIYISSIIQLHVQSTPLFVHCCRFRPSHAKLPLYCYTKAGSTWRTNCALIYGKNEGTLTEFLFNFHTDFRLEISCYVHTYLPQIR